MSGGSSGLTCASRISNKTVFKQSSTSRFFDTRESATVRTKGPIEDPARILPPRGPTSSRQRRWRRRMKRRHNFRPRHENEQQYWIDQAKASADGPTHNPAKRGSGFGSLLLRSIFEHRPNQENEIH